MTTQRLKRSLRLDMTDLLRPELHRQFPPEVLFEVFRWMVQTGWAFRDREQGYYGGDTRGVYELLWDHSGCGAQGHGQNDGIGAEWREFLRGAFCRALLENWDLGKLYCVCRWRGENWLAPGHVSVLPISHATRLASGWNIACDSGIGGALDWMLSRDGDKLAVQLNPCHKRARFVDHVALRLPGYIPAKLTWRMEVVYGYKGGGGWRHTVADQGRREPFAWFVRRAEKEMGRLLGVEADVRRQFGA